MVNLTDEIIQKISSSTFTFPFKDVRDAYSTKRPEYPMVTVNEVQNKPDLQLHGEEIRSKIGYRLEIYARDMQKGTDVYSKRQVITILATEIDAIMRETYGLKRITDPTILPYTADGSILRCILTYGGKIDNRTMIIYQ